MKRYILIVAAVAIAAVSCSKTYDVKHVKASEIGFGVWAENLTRAARDAGSSTFTADGKQDNDFAVYGYKAMNDKSDSSTVFNDVEVTTTNGTSWTYTTPRFWDSNFDRYIFFAISPASVGTEADGTNSSTDVNPLTGAFVTRSITFEGDNLDSDVLVADKKQVNKGSSPYFGNFATVPLVFNHVAALVDFNVKKASSLHDATVTVSDFELSQIYTTGALTVTAAYTGTHPVASWSDGSKGTYGPADGVIPVDISSPIEISEDTGFSASNTTPGTTPADSTYLIRSLVVKPQTFGATGVATSQQLSITYSIAVAGGGSNEYTNTLYLADFDLIDNDAQAATFVGGWQPGKHYSFHITIDAHKIDFSASITDWAAVQRGYHYLVN